MKTSTSLKYRKGGCLFSLVKLTILTVIILVVAAYFSMSFIADYILKTVTSGTGIDSGVSSVSMTISDQKLEIKNFYITNPQNFKKGNAIEFKDIVVDADIDITDVLTKKLIVLDEVKVVGLKMDIEIKSDKGLAALLTSSSSNLTEIKNVLSAKYGLDNNKSTKVQPAQNAQSNTVSNTTVVSKNNKPVSRDDQWKIIIKKMVFDDGTINGSINAKSLTVAVPSFALENIGVDKDGETPSELVTDVVTQLSVIGTTNLVKAAIKGGLDDGKDGASGAIDAVKNKLQQIFKKK